MKMVFRAIFIITGSAAKDEIFPWDFIDIGVSKNFLYREYENSLQEKVTPNCRAKCMWMWSRQIWFQVSAWNGGRHENKISFYKNRFDQIYRTP